MNLSMMSTPETPIGLIVNRTASDADSDYAVQVFLGSARNALYLSVDEARTLGERLLAAVSAAPAEVTA